MLQQEISQLRVTNQDLSSKLAIAEKRAPMFGGPTAAAGVPTAQEYQETCKRLKKREAECHALWDTLKDMKNSDG